MSILHRYIFKEIVLFFAISLFAFTGILLTLRMLRFATLVIDRGVALTQIAHVFIAIVPTFLEFAIPLATLLAVMLAFARMSGDSELVVMRGSGVSLFELISPVLIFGLLASMLGLWLAQEAKPWGYRRLSQTLFEIARSRTTAGLEQGVFNRLGTLTLYAEEIDYSTGNLKRVLIDDRRAGDQRKVVVAASGRIMSDDSERAVIISLDNGAAHEVIEGRYLITQFATNSLVLTPAELFPEEKKADRATDELYRSELKERIIYLENLLPLIPQEGALGPESFPQPMPAGLRAEEIERIEAERRLMRARMELARRVSLPFASFCLAILALPLGVHPPRQQRTWGAGLSIALGLLVFVIYYGLFSLGLLLAQSGAVHETIAVWIPNIATLFVALVLTWKTASEQWQSVAHAAEEYLQRLLRPIFAARIGSVTDAL